MTLNTFSDQPFLSPLTDISRTATREAVTGVGLADLSRRRRWHLRGKAGHAALREAFGNAPKAIGDALTASDVCLARLTAEEYLLIGAPDFAPPQALIEKAGLTVTDITHGRGHMLLLGPRAVDVLPKLCGLDFAESVFPNLHIAQSSLAKARTIILRDDQAEGCAYHLIVDRSLTAYVWDVVWDAMREFDGIRFSMEDS